MSDLRRVVKTFPGWAGLINPSCLNGVQGWTDTKNGTAVDGTHFTSASGAGLKLYVNANTVNKYGEATSDKIYVSEGSTILFSATGLSSTPSSPPTTDVLSVAVDFYTAANSLVGSAVSAQFDANHYGEVVALVPTGSSVAYIKVRVRHTATSGTGNMRSYWTDMFVRELVADLNDQVYYHTVRDSFQIQQGARGQAMAATGTRYGGAIVASEASDNDKAQWQALVAGSTVDEVLSKCESLVTATANLDHRAALEFRASGASHSTLYPIQGPAEFNLTHSKVRLEAGLAEYVDLSFPIAPLATANNDATVIPSTTMPATVQLNSVPGTAPAQADISIFNTGEAVPFCLFGWAKRPSTPLSGSVAPFGIIQAETGTPTTFVSTGTFTNYSGAAGLHYTASGAGTASALFALDPSVMEPDAFTKDTVDIEVWARTEIDPDVIGVKWTLSLEPFAGAGYGASRYTPEYGANGKLMVNKPSGSAALFRPVRLGTLTMPVNKIQPLKWNLKVLASWTSGAGVVGLDYLVLVPARQRAATRTGITLDANYPKFISGTGNTTKLISTDLSGRVSADAVSFAPDTGMGGAMIEPPAGNVDLVVWPSTLVPDDPTASAADMDVSHAAVTGNVYVTPRYYLVR